MNFFENRNWLKCLSKVDNCFYFPAKMSNKPGKVSKLEKKKKKLQAIINRGKKYEFYIKNLEKAIELCSKFYFYSIF